MRTPLKLVIASAILVPLVHASPAAADLTTACDPEDSTAYDVEAGRTLKSLQIPEAQAWLASHGKPPAGTNVTVAVLDSGVSTAAPLQLPVVAQVPLSARAGAPEYYHGTAVAGIIAGRPDSQGNPIGIAPAANILDVKIYDNNGGTQDGGRPVTPEGVMQGLEAVFTMAPTMPTLKVVNASVAIPDTVGMKTLIGKLWKRGIIVVASSGNRPPPDGDRLSEQFSSFHNGENAAKWVYPAGYDKVVAAATTAEGATDADPFNYILQNSAIDVAVPTAGAPSYGLLGDSCVLAVPATSWASAEVSGVLAMLWSTYPEDTPAEIVSRLESTASGRMDVRSPVTGAGVLQPYDAVSRPLSFDAKGQVVQSTAVVNQEKAELPAAEEDPLVSTRKNMVWFGVIGGGVLVLALVLRPVLARRGRRTT